MRARLVALKTEMVCQHSVARQSASGTEAENITTAREDSATSHRARECHLTNAAERVPNTSQPVRPAAPPTTPAKPNAESEAALAEPYLDARKSARCGLHGPCVRRDDCRLATTRVRAMLSQAGGGDAELPACHVATDTAWLAAEANNVLGLAR